MKMEALFDESERKQIADEKGEYGKIRKEWLEEKAATKKRKIDYVTYHFSSSDSDSEYTDKQGPLIPQKGLKLLSSDDESDDQIASSPLRSDTNNTDRCKTGNREITINSDSSSSIADDDYVEVIDVSDSKKLESDESSIQKSVTDCDSNLPSENIDENQIPLVGSDFLSYPSFYDELICVSNINSDEHEALMRSKDWLTQSLKREINENSPTNDDVIINHVHSEYTYKK